MAVCGLTLKWDAVCGLRSAVCGLRSAVWKLYFARTAVWNLFADTVCLANDMVCESMPIFYAVWYKFAAVLRAEDKLSYFRILFRGFVIEITDVINFGWLNIAF